MIAWSTGNQVKLYCFWKTSWRRCPSWGLQGDSVLCAWPSPSFLHSSWLSTSHSLLPRTRQRRVDPSRSPGWGRVLAKMKRMEDGCWLGEWGHLSIPRRPDPGSGLSCGILLRQNYQLRSGLHPTLHLFLCRKQEGGALHRKRNRSLLVTVMATSPRASLLPHPGPQLCKCQGRTQPSLLN